MAGKSRQALKYPDDGNFTLQHSEVRPSRRFAIEKRSPHPVAVPETMSGASYGPCPNRLCGKMDKGCDVGGW